MDWKLALWSSLSSDRYDSLEFAVNCAFRKMFSTKSYDVVSDCEKYFNWSVSNSICKRKTNFLAKLKCSDNVLIGLFSDVISTELSGLQLNYACTWSEFDIVHYFIHLHFLILVKYKKIIIIIKDCSRGAVLLQGKDKGKCIYIAPLL